MAFDIFFNQKDQQKINEKLTELFMTGTIVQRRDRSVNQHPKWATSSAS
jgi:hypothetical protein